jgi:hypothetical protein
MLLKRVRNGDPGAELVINGVIMNDSVKTIRAPGPISISVPIGYPGMLFPRLLNNWKACEWLCRHWM